MQIDWWTLALQTVNVLVLIWLLARFFFKPVTAIVARREEQARKLLADAEEAGRKVDQAEHEATEMRAKIAADRESLLAEAQRTVQAEHARLLAHANEELAKLRADAEAALDRDRAAAEQALTDRAGELAIAIAERLLRRLPPAATLNAFVDGLGAEIGSLSAQMREAFTSAGNDGEAVRVATAAVLDAEEQQRVGQALEVAFGAKLPLVFEHDPALIAGLELRCRHAAISNSWKDDLEKIREELKRDNELSESAEGLARTSEDHRRGDASRAAH